MTDVEGNALTLESVRAALAADLERDALAVVEVANLQSELGLTLGNAGDLYAALADKYAAVAAKPYLKDKLTELGVTDPAKLSVTIGGAKKAPTKKPAPPKKAAPKPKTAPSPSGPSAAGSSASDTAPGGDSDSPQG